MFLLSWVWQIKVCKLDFVWMYLCISEVMAFEFSWFCQLFLSLFFQNAKRKKNFQGTTFVQFFLYCKAKKKFRSDPKIFEKKIFLKIYLTDFLKQKKNPKFFGSLRNFFCFPIHKNWKKVVPWTKNFCSWKKSCKSKKNFFWKFIVHDQFSRILI